jgi:hypothetical protein
MTQPDHRSRHHGRPGTVTESHGIPPDNTSPGDDPVASGTVIPPPDAPTDYAAAAANARGHSIDADREQGHSFLMGQLQPPVDDVACNLRHGRLVCSSVRAEPGVQPCRAHLHKPVAPAAGRRMAGSCSASTARTCLLGSREMIGHIGWWQCQLRVERERRLRELIDAAVKRSAWHRARLSGLDPSAITEDAGGPLLAIRPRSLPGLREELETPGLVPG